MKTTFLLSAVLLAAACGGGKKDPDANLNRVDSRPQIDAMQTSNCTVNEDYGAATFMDSAGSYDPEVPDGTVETYRGAALLNQDTAPDLIQLILFNGYGGFMTAGIVPGTYPITGDDADWALCGACIIIRPDLVGDPAMSTDGDYLATSGSLDLTTVTAPVGATPGQLAGSVTGLGFEHYTLNADFTSTLIPDGCVTTIGSATFDIVIDPPAIQANPFLPTVIRVPLKH